MCRGFLFTTSLEKKKNVQTICETEKSSAQINYGRREMLRREPGRYTLQII